MIVSRGHDQGLRGRDAAGTDLHAGLGRAVAEVTGELYAGIHRNDLATAHRVLAQVTERAGQLRAGL